MSRSYMRADRFQQRYLKGLDDDEIDIIRPGKVYRKQGKSLPKYKCRINNPKWKSHMMMDAWGRYPHFGYKRYNRSNSEWEY